MGRSLSPWQSLGLSHQLKVKNSYAFFVGDMLLGFGPTKTRAFKPSRKAVRTLKMAINRKIKTVRVIVG